MVEYEYVGSGIITTKGDSNTCVVISILEIVYTYVQEFLEGVAAIAVYNYYSSRLRGV